MGRSWPWPTNVRYVFANRRTVGSESRTSIREAVSSICEVDVQYEKRREKTGRTVEILQVLPVSTTAAKNIGRSRVWRSNIRYGDHQAKKSRVKDPIGFSCRSTDTGVSS